MAGALRTRLAGAAGAVSVPVSAAPASGLLSTGAGAPASTEAVTGSAGLEVARRRRTTFAGVWLVSVWLVSLVGSSSTVISGPAGT